MTGKLNHSRRILKGETQAVPSGTFGIGAPFPFEPRSVEAREFSRIAGERKKLSLIADAHKRSLVSNPK